MGGGGSGGETGGGIWFDPATRSLRVEIAYGSAGGFTDLTGPAFAWYLHGPASVDRVGPVLVDLATLHCFAPDPGRGGFLDGSVLLNQRQAEVVLGNLSYLNIYTPDFPGGEIRGQLMVIPEPVGWSPTLVWLSLLLWRVAGDWRKQRKPGSS
jgi:hypothetical protein